MKLQEQISRIQSMMGGDNRNSSPIIERLLNMLFVDNHKDVVCKVDVKHPDDREVLEGQPKYESYSITITFIGGYGTKYWPKTMAVRDMYEQLMGEAWEIAYDYTNTPCDIYSKYIKKCTE